MKTNIWGKTALFALVAAAVLVTVFPFYWITNASFHNERLLYNVNDIHWFPDFTYWVNYIDIFQKRNFLRNMLNSFMVASMSMLIALGVSSIASYALARIKFPGAKFVLYFVLAISMFPAMVIISPLYFLLQKLGLMNSYAALILPYIAFTLPFSLWNLTTFFRKLPKELDESAEVDGSTPFQTFYKIMLPLVAPGMFTTAILVFISAWNEFLFAVTFISKDAFKTMPVAIVGMPSDYDVPWGQISAASFISTIPLVIMVLLFQKRIISGLTSGAVKG
ncbi:carbohydrate ABC transporter permease [Paenibacillus sp. TAB 01]|uniref:carbohydrate ABC transporter permease n=1 Tax=Paenibacillus sp. TAB 01 TaxID=3368988 RepID=UPI0037513AEE